MNSLEGHIIEVNTSGSLSLVSVRVGPNVVVKAIVIDTPETASYLEAEQPINVLFKETEVIIGANDNCNISLQNKITGTVKEIEKGALLSRVVVQTKVKDIISVISSNAVNELGLKENMKVTAMIKLNEIMLSNK